MTLTTSVIIATYDEARWLDLHEAIVSVQDQQPPATEIIIAVDHNAVLARRVRTEYPDVVVVENTGEQGASDNRNTAAAEATSDLLVFMDDDAVAGPGWLGAIAAAASQDDAIGAGGFLAPRWAGKQPVWFPLEFGWVVGASYTGQPDTCAPVRNVWSGSMAIRAKAFHSVGGFRSGFGKTGGRSRPEDTDLCIRAAAVHPGQHWYFEPLSRAEHKVPVGRSSWRYFCSRSWAEGRGKVALGSLVGPRALVTEGAFGVFAVPRGVVRELACAVRGDAAGLLRAFALTIGLLLTVGGALAELAAGVARPRSAPAENRAAYPAAALRAHDGRAVPHDPAGGEAA